jgi:N-acetylmuramoyl-L-alanine amidase
MTRLARARAGFLLATMLIGVASMPLRAQTVPTTVPTVEALFADASAKEAAVRKALAAAGSLPSLLKALRTVVADYESVVRHYPTSGFSDDALWRAATLSRDAFEEFHDARERATALRLLQLLESQYPSSKLARQVPDQVAWLNAHPAKPADVPTAPPTVASAPASPVPPAAATAAQPASARLVTIRAIRRAVLADTVRVVIELDSEVAFHDERLDNPNRVFLDLPATRAEAPLLDQTLRFDADTDIVRQIRVGRQPNNTTRVVIEAAGVSSYSVYPLYSPFRLVIDCLRAAPSTTTGAVRAPILPAASTAEARTPAEHRGAAAGRPALTTPPAKVPAVPALPPPLPARRVSWPVPMPAGTVAALRDAAAPVPSDAVLPAAQRDKPTAGAQPALPVGQPANNVAGGLSIARQLGLGVSRIVIDPGHGGHDPGAKGEGVTEAELVLDVAVRLEKLLGKLRGVEVVLTRRDDDFITLQERTAIANREGADLFLSIHANASSVPAARGVETYFLNFASNQSAAAVAARENATSGQTMGALQDVVKAIALNSKLDESRDFATYVQREMLDSLRPANKTVKDLGVKQAPFAVLIGASMPSILAEISFVTNPQEAKLLKSGSYRQRIAQALFEGIRKYQVSLKNAPAVAQQQQQN